jgi:hypothetical protein
MPPVINSDGMPFNRGRELEVIAVKIRAGQEAFLLVIAAMPASLRERGDCRD